MRMDSLTADPLQLPTYSPPLHTGTVNRRLVGRSMGASSVEVVLGEILPGGEAEPHSHPANEQAVYVLAGNCQVTCLGETRTLVAGQSVFFPKGVEHRVQAMAPDLLRLLVIYAPPLQLESEGR